MNAAIANSGTITADGGKVALLASSLSDTLPTVINQSGVIRANSIAEQGGTIVLSGGAQGVVSVSGTLEAKGANAGETGGTVKVLGDKVALRSTAQISASGDAGGGTVLVGGNWQGKGTEQNATSSVMATGAQISADAVTRGDGGTVVVWADGSTAVGGAISATGGAQGGNGGRVETSGKDKPRRCRLRHGGHVRAAGEPSAPGCSIRRTSSSPTAAQRHWAMSTSSPTCRRPT